MCSWGENLAIWLWQGAGDPKGVGCCPDEEREALSLWTEGPERLLKGAQLTFTAHMCYRCGSEKDGSVCNTHLCVCLCVSDGGGALSGRRDLHPPPISLPKKNALQRKRNTNGKVQAELGEWGPPLPLCLCSVAGGSGTLESDLGSNPKSGLDLLCNPEQISSLVLSSPHQDDGSTSHSCGDEGDKTHSFISHYSTVL